MVTWPVSRRSRDEAPTEMVYVPPAVVQPLLQYWKLRAASVTVTCWVWPGSRFTRWKARRLRGGSPTAAGWVRYTWATSAPARLPVLVTSNPTVTLPALSGVDTERFAYPKVVYDSPYPNGNMGVLFCASYQRYPTWSPSEYWTWLFCPGHCEAVLAGTSATSWFWSVDRSMFDRSAPSPSPLLTNTTAKLAFRAAVTAASCRFWFGMIQPRLSWLPPPSWK